jgi:serine protease Do
MTTKFERASARIVAAAILVAFIGGCSGGGNNDSSGQTSGYQSGSVSATATEQVASNSGAGATDTPASSGGAATTTVDTSSASSTATSDTSSPVATATSGSTTTAEAAPAPAAASAGDFSSAVRNVVQKVRPAVVQITNQQVQLDQFNNADTVPAGVGSGVIYDEQGHILTNNHVIAGAQSLLVSLPDGRSFPAKLIGADPQTDLAVVQISGDNLPVAQLGDSGKLQVGDWVVAIGNALALPGGPTVTAGVVSALGRSVQEPGDQNSQTAGPLLFDVIQTSAPINPGNSGGPLLNLNGEVVGINTLVAGQAEPGVTAQGIGFAVSMSVAKPVADALVSTGHVVYPYMGIRYVPLTPAIASQIGSKARNGVAIAQVVRGTPAEQAGLQVKDVITAIDGKQIVSESDLALNLRSHKPGDTVSLTVDRAGKQMDVQVTLGTMPTQ